MEDQFNKNSNIVSKIFPFTLFSFLSFPILPLPAESKDKLLHTLPINSTIIYPANQELVPMPTGDIKSSSKNVNFDRNPFASVSDAEKTNINDLDVAIEFKGIAQSKDNLVAIIRTKNGHGYFKVGESLNNGFLIKSISLDEVTVDITNGSRNYRLSLSEFKDSL